MRQLLLVLLAMFLLVGCNKPAPSSDMPSVPQTPAVKAPAPIPVPQKSSHFYTMRDGYEYGYERQLSVNEANSGQAATTLIMLQYAGEKNGKFQVYHEEKGVFSVFECAEPCEFIKSMVFYNGHLVKTERMRATGTIAEAALMDARGGMLDQAIRARDSQPTKRFNIWFDEKTGYKTTPVEK